MVGCAGSVWGARGCAPPGAGLVTRRRDEDRFDVTGNERLGDGGVALALRGGRAELPMPDRDPGPDADRQTPRRSHGAAKERAADRGHDLKYRDDQPRGEASLTRREGAQSDDRASGDAAPREHQAHRDGDGVRRRPRAPEQLLADRVGEEIHHQPPEEPNRAQAGGEEIARGTHPTRGCLREAHGLGNRHEPNAVLKHLDRAEQNLGAADRAGGRETGDRAYSIERELGERRSWR